MVTQVERDRANAWQLQPGQGRSKRGQAVQETWSHCSLMDAVVSHTGVCNGTQVLNPCCTKCHSQCSYHRRKKCNNLSCTRLSCYSFNPNALTIDFCTTFLCRTCLSPALRGSTASPASSPQCQQLSIIKGHSEELSSSQPKK